MRIDLNGGISGSRATEERSQEGSRAASAAGAGGPASDQAVLSADQGRVGALAVQVNNLPEVRSEKVAAIASAIRKQTYQVTPEQTAEAILGELQARNGRAA